MLKTCPPMRSVVARLNGEVLASTWMLMPAPPAPTVGERNCTQPALLTASQAHGLAAIICRVSLPPAALYLAEVGLIWKVQSDWPLPACRIIKLWPPTLMLPMRGLVLALSRTRKRIVAGPLPFVAEVMTTQLLEGVAFQKHPALHSRSNCEAPPYAPSSRLAADSVKAQLAGFCVTVRVAVHTVTVPVRPPPGSESTV